MFQIKFRHTSSQFREMSAPDLFMSRQNVTRSYERVNIETENFDFFLPNVRRRKRLSPSITILQLTSFFPNGAAAVRRKRVSRSEKRRATTHPPSLPPSLSLFLSHRLSPPLSLSRYGSLPPPSLGLALPLSLSLSHGLSLPISRSLSPSLSRPFSPSHPSLISPPSRILFWGQTYPFLQLFSALPSMGVKHLWNWLQIFWSSDVIFMFILIAQVRLEVTKLY